MNIAQTSSPVSSLFQLWPLHNAVSVMKIQEACRRFSHILDRKAISIDVWDAFRGTHNSEKTFSPWQTLFGKRAPQAGGSARPHHQLTKGPSGMKRITYAITGLTVAPSTAEGMALFEGELVLFAVLLGGVPIIRKKVLSRVG